METANKEVNKETALLLMKSQRKTSEIYTKTQALANSPQSFTAEQELLLDLKDLKSTWLSINDNQISIPPEAFSSLETIFTAGLYTTENGLNIVKAFYDLMNRAVFYGLINWISAYIYEEEKFAEELFKFCIEAPRSDKSAVFLVNLIEKLKFPTEREKFDFLMSMIEKYPNLLSGTGMTHPQYIYKPSAQRTFEKCPVCGGAGEPYHCAFSYRMSDFDYPFQPFKLWMRCGDCKNLYSEQFPEDFLKLSDHHKEITPSENSQTAVSNTANTRTLSVWSDILNKLRRYTEKKSLLEVGIGNGELLSVALEMNYQADAVEIVEESAQRVSDILGIPIKNGDFLNYTSDKTYSIIIMGDVIEHVTDPEAALRNAYKLLDEDGVLWLSTPNYESSFTRLKKFTDPMWLEPYHITYFNYDGLEKLLRKCGFTVREYSVSNRYNGSMELIITKKQ